MTYAVGVGDGLAYDGRQKRRRRPFRFCMLHFREPQQVLREFDRPASGYGYRRPDGVHVIPVGALGP